MGKLSKLTAKRARNRITADHEDSMTYLGRNLTFYALAKEFGFGPKRLARLRKRMDEIEAQINEGTQPYSVERQHNAIYSLYRIHKELDRVTKTKDFSKWFDEQRWVE